MTLDTFYKTFDQFADAPDAVAKMRELVLNLAVQGKLVSQNSKDEPATTLLKQIEEQKGKTFDPGETKSVPYLVPSGWVWVKLGFVADVERGGSPRPIQEFITTDPDGLNWIKIGDTEKGGRYITSTREKIRKEGLKKTRKVYPGDFLLTNSMSFGRPYISKIEGCIHDGWLRIHPPGQIMPEYLYHLLSSSSVYAFFCKSAAGAVVQNLNADKVRELPIPLPPLAEQKRIVAKVNELMALCDRLEAQQQERDEQASALARASLARFAEAPTPANLNLLFHKDYSIAPGELRKAILTLAVQGRLLPQDSNDESVDVLLKRCLAERKKFKRTTAMSVQTIAADKALGYAIPVSWRWQTLDDLLIVGPTNGFSPKAVDYETPVRSLTLSATTSGRFKGEHSKFIEMDLADDADLWLSDGDILVQRGNTLEYVGVPAVYRGEPNQYIYPDLMMKLRLSSAFDVGYIHLAMSHDASRDFLRARASGTSGSMPKINQTALKNLPLPIPPLAEQCRIVSKVDQLMSLVDQLETQLAASRSTAKNLLEAVVAELTSTH